MKKKIKYRTYKTIESILYKMYGDFDSIHDMHGKSYSKKDFIKNIANHAWGFADGDTNIIHLWTDGEDDEQTIELIAHEIGHLTGKRLKSKKNFMREEKRADEYAKVALKAFQIFKKINGKIK